MRFYHMQVYADYIIYYNDNQEFICEFIKLLLWNTIKTGVKNL